MDDAFLKNCAAYARVRQAAAPKRGRAGRAAGAQHLGGRGELRERETRGSLPRRAKLLSGCGGRVSLFNRRHFRVKDTDHTQTTKVSFKDRTAGSSLSLSLTLTESLRSSKIERHHLERATSSGHFGDPKVSTHVSGTFPRVSKMKLWTVPSRRKAQVTRGSPITHLKKKKRVSKAQNLLNE